MMIVLVVLLVGCNNQTNETADNNEDEQSNEASVNIRNVEVKVQDDLQATITGEASLFESGLYYVLEQGDTELLSEEEIVLESNPHGFSTFEILLDIPQDSISKEQAPVVKLYGKNASGEEVNPNYVPIDLEAE